jgi:hypothetical protein
MGNAPATLRIGIDTPCIQSGQDVHGKVYVMVTQETKVTTLNLTLRGQEYTRVHYTTTSGTGKNRKTHHKTATSTRDIMKIDIPLASFAGGVILPGNYEFPFTATMPSNLPSSMSVGGQVGDTCRIEYFANARLTRPGTFKFDATATNKFVLLSKPVDDVIKPAFLRPSRVPV